MGRNKGLLTQGKSKFIRLREVRDKLVRKPTGKPSEIKRNGRDEWIGWFELIEDQVSELAIDNTARIVKEIDADILCVVEADNRIALQRFNKTVLKSVGGTPYEHVMLIDGNDERGIERRGVRGGKNGTLFPHLPEINNPVDAASDHAAVWVDFQ